jgi:hypothetical protein
MKQETTATLRVLQHGLAGIHRQLRQLEVAYKELEKDFQNYVEDEKIKNR